MQSPGAEAVIPAATSVGSMRTTNIRWRIFGVMMVLVAINYLDRSTVSLAMPLLSHEFALTPIEQGLLFSTFFWSYTLMQLPSGFMIDRIKPRGVVALAACLWGLWQTLTGFCTSTIALLVTRIGLGASEAPIFPAGGKLIALWMTPTERARGAAMMDSGAVLGAAFGSIIVSGLIAAFGSWRFAFWGTGVATVLCGIAAWTYLRNAPSDHAGVNEPEAELIASSHAKERAAHQVVASGTILSYFRYRSAILLFLAVLCYNTLWTSILSWMPNFLNQVYHFNILNMGTALFFAYFCGFVGENLLANVIDRSIIAGKRRNTVIRTVFGGAAAVSTVALFVLSVCGSPFAAIGLLCATLFFVRAGGLLWSVPSMISAPEKVGQLGGLMSFLGNIGGVFIPLIVGAILQFTGSYFLVISFFGLMGLGFVLSVLFINYEEKLPV